MLLLLLTAYIMYTSCIGIKHSNCRPSNTFRIASTKPQYILCWHENLWNTSCVSKHTKPFILLLYKIWFNVYFPDKFLTCYSARNSNENKHFTSKHTNQNYNINQHSSTISVAEWELIFRLLTLRCYRSLECLWITKELLNHMWSRFRVKCILL